MQSFLLWHTITVKLGVSADSPFFWFHHASNSLVRLKKFKKFRVCQVASVIGKRKLICLQNCTRMQS